MDDKDLLSLLFSAIQHHNDSLLEDLLGGENAGTNLLDMPGSDGHTLLHVAVRENDLSCLICLLKHGADPNVFDATSARSPLHLAVELGLTDIVKIFLQLQHVNLELRDDRNLTCYEIAQFCDNQALADLILSRKLETEKFKDEFYTVMNQACTNNQPKLVRELFERYERKLINNLPKGWHPYKDKRVYSRSMLKELINWSSSSWNDVTLLFKSASKGHTEVCRLLIDFGATAKCNENTNYSPLYVAAYGGYTSTVRLFLDSFPSLVQEVTIEKWTVLHACCLQGHWDTAKLILRYQYPEGLSRRFVSRSGLYEYDFAFNLNAQDAAGQTVIYLAVSANDESLLDTLLEFKIEAKLIGDPTNKLTPSNDNQLQQAKRSNNPQLVDGIEQQPQRARIIPDRPRLKNNTDTERTSRFNPSNHVDKIMRQLRKLQFSKETETTDNSEPICVKNDDNKYLICPFEMDTYCDYNSKTALHLAVCQQYHNIATTLLVNGSNPNLPILFRDSIKGDSSASSGSSGIGSVIGASSLSGDIGLNWLRSSKSTCLKEACRLNDERMCEILIRYGARDNPDNLALQVAAMNKNTSLISMFLSLKSNIDPEYKINRKCNVEFASRYKQCQKLSKSAQGNATTTFSSMFPSAPVTIDWQNLKCIQKLDPQWLIDASLAHNKRLRHPTNSLTAITRLDLSSNNLKSVHPVIFRLPSLRELNLSSNRLESLLDINIQRKISHDREPNTPTSKLIESQRTAMKRSKSSSFTNTGASLENSNVIDLNEPQEWDLPYLEVLDLHDNLLISLPDCLFELPKLSELDVSSNQLRQLPWAMWTAPSLKELIATSNLLDDLPKAPPQSKQNQNYSSTLETISDTHPEGDKAHLCNESFDKFDQSASFLNSFESITSKNPAYFKVLKEAKSDIREVSVVSSSVPLIHLNHWSKRIDLTSEPSNSRTKTNTNSQDSSNESENRIALSKLTYLNLSQNSFATIPPVLACIATELTRLNLSYNRLESLGDISLYPVDLKNLDLSNNQLKSWFQFNQLDDDTKHCYTINLTRTSCSSSLFKKQRGHANLYCIHKLHQRLDSLKSFNLSHNQLKDIQIFQATPATQLSLINKTASIATTRETHSTSPSARGLALLYPNVTALDVSYNKIQRVPETLSELKDLSVLNLNGNTSIATLPAELGLANKLWNLGVNGCNLSEPLKSIVESKTYKTMDIIGYLKSILEEAKQYARMKLMLVGLQGIGKTSLLEQMRQEGSTSYRRRAPEHWTKRMGHTSRSNLKNQKGVTLSTVGVDIHDWIYQKRTPRNQHSFGPVSFSTWDFGGQEEFYATHRYFLSRRSMYLVVWRLTDGINGILGIQQWLVNIQSRAPSSPVIIVGTHEDMIEGGERSELVHKLQSEVHRRFIDVSDHDKCGLPRIMDSIVVSTKTKLNIKNLCNRIYDVVFSLRCPGSTERLLEQKIPATYLYLEEIVTNIVHERHQKKREPVLTYDEYKRLTSEQLKCKYNKTFRDLEPLNTREINYNSELQQATRFLHENGVLLHYEDSNLRDLYFLDPQWLCDILSHVVTIREINPHVKNGLMKIDDLGHLFKSMDINLSGGVQSYVVNLLNKFEVALTWNSQYLLIPSLLPTSPDSLSEQYSDFQVKLAPRMRGRSVVRRHELNRVAALRSTSIDPIKKGPAGKQRLLQANSLKNFYEFEYKAESIISRLVLLRYLPAGFLARLQSGILSDPAFDDACEDLQLDIIQNVLSETDDEASEFANLIGGRPSWLCWKKGIRLSLQKESTINTRNDLDLLSPNLMTIQEISPSARELMLNQINFKIECTQIDSHDDDDDDAEGAFNNCAATKWIDFDISQYSNIISVSVPNPQLKVTNKEDRSLVKYINLDHLIVAKLLSKAVDYIDDLLEDWYPSLGARFAHTLGGNYLVTRIVPCQNCSTNVSLHRALGYSPSVALQSSRSSRASLNSDRVSRMSQDKRGIKFSINSIRDGDSINNQRQQLTIADTSEQKEIIYCYYVEHCILFAYDLTPLSGRRQSKISNINLNQQQQQQQPQRNLKKTSSRLRNLHCPKHGSIQVSSVAPDIVFDDVPNTLKIDNEQLERCKLIGRGALGFVFKGSLHNASQFSLQHANQNEVALKLLQPVDPGPEADQADLIAYNSAKTNWNREPFQCACKSYCSARHEVNILQTISHANIVSFIGLCLKPLAIVLELAPLGSLADVLKNYKRACIRIDQYTVQKSILQVAKALEFLHQHRVIYRDLKTENILVWSFPSPFATQHQAALVELKLADYGISRQAMSTGIWKGFAGTMSYLAPEILRHNGDEEYTEKVDCFSFGMFLYELLTLRPPYKFNEGAYGGGGGGGGGFGGGPVAGPIRSQFSDGSGGGRPTLSKRDLIYPNYMLDLMSLCWSQEPHDRPTASQIVSIASTPEFMQIHDAVMLDTGDKLSFCCAINHGQDVNLWFGSRVTQVNQVSQINVLATSQDQWVGLESIELSQQERSSLLSTNLITAMCLVDNKLWLCDLRGVIHVTSARPRAIACDKSAELGTAPPAKDLSVDTSVVSSVANCDDNEDDSGDIMEVQSFQLVDHRNKAANLHEVKSLVYIEHAYSVVFLTRDGLLWTCNLATMICDQLGDSSIRYNCIALPKQNQAVVDDDQSLNRPTAVQNSNIDPELHLLSLEPVAGPTIRLYCGQTNGISSLEICESEIRRQSILPLNCGASNDSDEPQSLADAVLNETDSYNETLSEGSEICHIVVCSSDSNEDLLWTAANCTVHLWNIKEKRVIRKLECWKLVPCSESLESINIEQYYQQTKTSQVTSMVYMSDQLFVGTSHGCFIVIEASNLKPMTVFRPYESHVTILRPIRYAPNRNSIINRNDQQQQQQQPNALDEQAHYLVALGFGYRDLMKRYLTSGGSLENDIASTANESKSTLPNGGAGQKLVAILLAPASQYNL